MMIAKNSASNQTGDYPNEDCVFSIFSSQTNLYCKHISAFGCNAGDEGVIGSAE